MYIFKVLKMKVILLYTYIHVLALNGLSDAVNVYGLFGSTVQLICPHSGQGIIWTKTMPEPTKQYSEGNVINPRLDPELKNRLSITGNHNAGEFQLNISDLRQNDAGVYQCVTLDVTTADQTLYIINAPSNVMIENKSSINNRLLATEGQDLTIRCTAIGGNPVPDVKLYIPGLSTKSGKQFVANTIKAVDLSFDGNIINCTASNNPNTPAQRSDTAVIYLNLKPLQPTMNPDPVSTEETVPLVVNCTSHGSRPAGNFQWYIGHSRNNVTNNSSQKVQSTSTDTYTVTSTLIVSVDRSSNNHKIECAISNAATSDAVITFKTMDIKYAPKIIVQNTTLDKTSAREIQCVLDGNPDRYIFDKWLHNSVRGTFIRELEGAQTLPLPSVATTSQYQDTGEYICTANNGIKDKTGRIKQTGSGYVTSNAPPVFTQDNNASRIQYGEFRKTGKIFVNVYSIPKYSSFMWYHGSKQLTSSKYAVSDEEVTVQDTFYGKEVELDGYRVTLTINELTPDDFGNYTVRLYSGFPHVEYTVTLESAVFPELTVVGSTESTITVNWDAYYSGEYNETYNIEYRKQGSSVWSSVEITLNKNNLQDRITHTLTGLQDGTIFEMKVYLGNANVGRIYTPLTTVQTLFKDSQSTCGSIVGGVTGGLLLAVAVSVSISFIVFKRLQSKTSFQKAQFEKEYDTIGMETISDVQMQDHQQKQHSTTNTYEASGVRDKPNIYDELKDKDANRQISAEQYETLGMQDKPNIYEELENKNKREQKVYENQKSLSY